LLHHQIPESFLPCNDATLHGCTAQHSTAQHSTAQHSTAQHSTAQHSTAQQSAHHIHVCCALGRSTTERPNTTHSMPQQSAQHTSVRDAEPLLMTCNNKAALTKLLRQVWKAAAGLNAQPSGPGCRYSAYC
jgi:hypothetical protein